MFRSPLAQFDVINVFFLVYRNYEVSLTNLSFTFMIVIIIMYFIFNKLFLGHMIPRAIQQVLESIFVFIYRLVYQQLGNRGMIYFPFIFGLFLLILFLNLFSLLPYGFAVTSHFV
jgi:F-type H+-transporting ATPase subunit a